MIAIIDYGAGNIKSLQFALERLAIPSLLTDSKAEIEKADAIILPGVGAFTDAMKQLRLLGLDEVIKTETAKNKPLLGICLGMQMLYETSDEGGMHHGLGLLKGAIRRIPDNVKVPHMGWNNLDIHQKLPLLKHVENGEYVYFVHSYYAAEGEPEDLVADARYSLSIPAVVQHGNVIGIQFHPEKSGKTGMKILKNFGEMIS
ncbi:imidazole glycerol phosphate synthase subunit HisH [Virgibacillus sp. 179-BFC.A HS]|uniref:Imidazole glycerol phosphate synthase subunit HisH n=1 Tax=Tigheibacillus jepli TaxID=3035914 RepID=A0ABU5CKE5_9BACI|nr:imidazole glycerol phosphate synthase subunit HisH [Virgibacillus sp. 179-BFC.A HS]MDY0406818.1 imidazole glycerol phosphate synthase subunit HisH [Virgibacillus sp. 179-BFC.A HS]